MLSGAASSTSNRSPIGNSVKGRGGGGLIREGALIATRTLNRIIMVSSQSNFPLQKELCVVFYVVLLRVKCRILVM